MDEEWRAIPGYPNYEVSNLGNVRRVVQMRKPHKNAYGYYTISLVNEYGSKKIGVHRLVAMAFIGPAPSPDHIVAHNDGVRDNNVSTNVRWATQTENSHDKYKHGTMNQGSRNGLAKITEEQARCCKCLRNQGFSYAEISKHFAISHGTIRSCVMLGWRHVPAPTSPDECCKKIDIRDIEEIPHHQRGRKTKVFTPSMFNGVRRAMAESRPEESGAPIADPAKNLLTE